MEGGGGRVGELLGLPMKNSMEEQDDQRDDDRATTTRPLHQNRPSVARFLRLSGPVVADEGRQVGLVIGCS
jgi:hypothetical protein